MHPPLISEIALFAEPLKTKSKAEVQSAFEKIFKAFGSQIHVLESDRGLEFTSLERFFKQQKTVNFLNIEHNQNNDVQGTILEAWLVEDTKMDKSALYGFEMPVGTWMLSVHIDNTEFTSDKVTVTVNGAGTNATILKGKFESNSDNCFSINKGFIDLFSVDSIKAKKDTFTSLQLLRTKIGNEDAINVPHGELFDKTSTSANKVGDIVEFVVNTQLKFQYPAGISVTPGSFASVINSAIRPLPVV